MKLRNGGFEVISSLHSEVQENGIESGAWFFLVGFSLFWVFALFSYGCIAENTKLFSTGALRIVLLITICFHYCFLFIVVKKHMIILVAMMFLHSMHPITRFHYVDGSSTIHSSELQKDQLPLTR